MEHLNYHHLRYFWVVAHEGSVSRAAKKLRVSQPTVSEQLHALHDSLGVELLRREGRGLVLTEHGHAVLQIADEIFALGGEILDTVKDRPNGKPRCLSVGIADVVPKLIAFRILEPALSMSERVRVVCHEDSPSRLLEALVGHELDVVLTDAPAPSTPPLSKPTSRRAGVGGDAPARRVYSHVLGESKISVFGSPRLAKELRVGFPRSLDGAPFLLPIPGTDARRELDAWFAEHEIVPHVVGEFQDTALLSEFAEARLGLFAAPEAIASEERKLRGLELVGALHPLRARYYAITIERRIVHPALAVIAGAARDKMFGGRPTNARE